jgi:hypothetical protein
LKVGEWTTTTARIDGAKISLWLNGTFCLDYTFTNAEHLDGNIFAIQSHPPFDLIEWESIKMRKLNVLGCTNKNAPNYNPEATKDDGTCRPPVSLEIASAAMGATISVSGNLVSYDIPAAGPYTARLLDVNGAVAGTASGKGPLRGGKLELSRPGIYFLELTSAGTHTRHRIDGF